MKSIQSSDISHITRVLSSFEYRDSFYLIFPLAEEDLGHFWAHSRPSSSTSSWCLEQMAGLSTGLSTLHDAAGWYFDLKPENVLVFRDFPSRGLWKISDFGTSYVHQRDSKLELSSYPGTGKYEPPGCQLNLQQSQKYDIWSLGCMLLGMHIP